MCCTCSPPSNSSHQPMFVQPHSKQLPNVTDTSPANANVILDTLSTLPTMPMPLENSDALWGTKKNTHLLTFQESNHKRPTLKETFTFDPLLAKKYQSVPAIFEEQASPVAEHHIHFSGDDSGRFLTPIRSPQKQPSSPQHHEQVTLARPHSIHSTIRPPVITAVDIGIPHVDDNGIIKRGRLLSKKIMTWYGKRTSSDMTQNNMHLRQTRLRWREFMAVLKPDRLELYLVTNVVIKTQRLAHTIYLTKRGGKEVTLSLVSPVDSIWRLQYRSVNGREVSFLFLAQSRTLTQEWYMAVYRLIPRKKAIPFSIDLTIPALKDLYIRLPTGQLQDNQDIQLGQIKTCALELLDKEHLRPNDWQADAVTLCWRGTHEQIEWILDEKDHPKHLLSPQFLERTHQLELRPIKRESEPLAVMEGKLFLLTDKRGRPLPQPKEMYALLVDRFLFFLNCVDALLPDGAAAKKSRLTGFGYSVASMFGIRPHTHDGIYFRSPGVQLTEQNKLKADIARQTHNVSRTHTVVDLTQADKVQPTREESFSIVKDFDRKGFEIHYGTIIVALAAESIQIRHEWMQRIRKLMSSTKTDWSSLVLKEAGLWHQMLLRRCVLQQGMLYLRNHSMSTFKKRFCVLVRDKGLMVFKQAKHTHDAFHDILQTTITLDHVYLYSDKACSKDYLSRQPERPSRFFTDGSISEDDNTSCIFVIWRSNKRHVLATLRERLYMLKIGHRLGQKGTGWVFLARNRQEREAWVWALHHEIQYKLSTNLRK